MEILDRYNNIFENIDSPEKSYWIGFIAGDGSITMVNKKTLFSSLHYGGRFQVEKVCKLIYGSSSVYLDRKFSIYKTIIDYNRKHKYHEKNQKYNNYINGKAVENKICIFCNSEFTSRIDHNKRPNCGRFCSISCSMKWRHKYASS